MPNIKRAGAHFIGSGPACGVMRALQIAQKAALAFALLLVARLLGAVSLVLLGLGPLVLLPFFPRRLFPLLLRTQR
jgi:hypothetical protein